MPMQERFAQPSWEKSQAGSPMLRDALACFDCRITQALEIGTHWVIFGVVEDIRISSEYSALLYLHRQYRELSWRKE
jgi:flavin reductase (DIM6/NTAB) family NADH-FMN oxidoreductase RutF